MKFCPECGNKLIISCKYCPECGQRLFTDPDVGQTAEQTQNEPVGRSGMPLSAATLREKATQPDVQGAEKAAYDESLEKARVYCVLGKYDEAKAIYDGIVEKNPLDMNGYMGFIRVATRNYTVFEGDEIRERIRIARCVARKDDLSGYDIDYAKFSGYLETVRREKEAAERKAKEEERRKLRAAQEEEEKKTRAAKEVLDWLARGQREYNSGNYAEAVKWYSAAAERGNVSAQSWLAICYFNGLGVKQDYAEAAKWYGKAAEQGDASAQCWYASCYYNGWGVTQSFEEAVKWYQKSAEAGYASAQCWLGICCYNGQGLAQDHDAAAKWFRSAADRGDAAAQCWLGICYTNGEGVAKDYAEAVQWFGKSASQGYVHGEFMLAESYFYGHGVEKNRAEAKKWYQYAAAQGHEEAKKKSMSL